MPALNFQPRFAELILSGAKRQTVRQLRRRPIRPGETLHLYTGQRTQQVRFLGYAVCDDALKIRISPDADRPRVEVEGIGAPVKPDFFARRDGFSSWGALRAFFASVYPGRDEIAGVLITWRDFRASKNGISPAFDAALKTSGAGWSRK
jgi:hypothetical protein